MHSVIAHAHAWFDVMQKMLLTVRACSLTWSGLSIEDVVNFRACALYKLLKWIV